MINRCNNTNIDNGYSISEQSSLSLFTPEGLRRAEESGEFDVNTNLLDLRPDPTYFVAFLKSLDRLEVVSNLFISFLESYQENKADPYSDPLRCAGMSGLQFELAHSQAMSRSESFERLSN